MWDPVPMSDSPRLTGERDVSPWLSTEGRLPKSRREGGSVTMSQSSMVLGLCAGSWGCSSFLRRQAGGHMQRAERYKPWSPQELWVLVMCLFLNGGSMDNLLQNWHLAPTPMAPSAQPPQVALHCCGLIFLQHSSLHPPRTNITLSQP